MIRKPRVHEDCRHHLSLPSPLIATSATVVPTNDTLNSGRGRPTLFPIMCLPGRLAAHTSCHIRGVTFFYPRHTDPFPPPSSAEFSDIPSHCRRLPPPPLLPLPKYKPWHQCVAQRSVPIPGPPPPKSISLYSPRVHENVVSKPSIILMHPIDCCVVGLGE